MEERMKRTWIGRYFVEVNILDVPAKNNSMSTVARAKILNREELEAAT